MTALRGRLEALTGVERVLLDEGRDGLWVLAQAEADRSALEDAVRAVIAQEGLGSTLPVELVTRWSQSARHRVRFVGVERLSEPEVRRCCSQSSCFWRMRR